VELHPVNLDEVDLSDIEFWSAPHDYRESVFAAMRRESPIRFFAERPVENIPAGPGYWALTRHADIWHVSRNPESFCSGQGTNITAFTPELNEFFGSMINMDDPKHFRIRSIVSKGFTPREVARIEDYVRDTARTLVDRVLAEHGDGSEFDFVEKLAAPLPLQIICDMMGIPSDDAPRILRWTNEILGATDPDFGATLGDLLRSGLELYQYAQAHGEERLARPTDDLTSIMMHGEVDGERMTSQEFGSFFILLVVAGNETTRNAISHGMHALTHNADQRRTWFDNFEAHTRTAVEEIVRWATPVIHFRRTATRDTELGGVPLPAGSKVVMFYNSGNRDDAVYPDPYRFDVTRPLQPNQIGFGAGGPHFCLGANLARREIAVAFDEIRRRLPGLRVTGEPSYLRSNFINGIKTMPCRLLNKQDD
jgi:cytochrome P450